jgi:hypothetical protein
VGREGGAGGGGEGDAGGGEQPRRRRGGASGGSVDGEFGRGISGEKKEKERWVGPVVGMKF